MRLTLDDFEVDNRDSETTEIHYKRHLLDSITITLTRDDLNMLLTNMDDNQRSTHG